MRSCLDTDIDPSIIRPRSREIRLPQVIPRASNKNMAYCNVMV